MNIGQNDFHIEDLSEAFLSVMRKASIMKKRQYNNPGPTKEGQVNGVPNEPECRPTEQGQANGAPNKHDPRVGFQV